MYFWSFWGMNFLWWIFWIAIIAVFFSLMAPVSRRRVRTYDHPLSILRRRYAAGEITTEEYEDRKARLERDERDAPSARIDRHQHA